MKYLSDAINLTLIGVTVFEIWPKYRSGVKKSDEAVFEHFGPRFDLSTL